MLKFTYQVTINALPAYDDAYVAERMSGELEASDHAQAKQWVQSRAWDRCRQLQQECGGLFGYENVQVTVAQDGATALPMSYTDLMQAYKQEKALPASTPILLTVAEFTQHEHDLIKEVFEEVQAKIAQFWQKREGSQ